MLKRVTRADFAKSVMAVPPLARRADGGLNPTANGAIIHHLEQGGVTTIIYGGNALAHHWPTSAYPVWLDCLEAQCAKETWLIPSVGVDGGKLVDQATALKSRDYPAALLLPLAEPRTREGTMEALRRFHGDCGVQLIVYIKADGYMSAADLGVLTEEGVVLGIKYAVPRKPEETDAYLQAIIAEIGADAIVSGFGEPPAIAHLSQYGLASFTAGCVCLAPSLSTAILRALQTDNRDEAERLLQPMIPLETLRGQINEIRVLHEAISLSGLADCGAILAPSSPVPEAARDEILKAAHQLLQAEQSFRASQAA
jgi:4-hydroxy-tetrahydrodipicolinate synthase